jgi:hypothetical protein
MESRRAGGPRREDSTVPPLNSSEFRYMGDRAMTKTEATGVPLSSEQQRTSDRRSFLKKAPFVGATGILGFGQLVSLASAQPKFSRPTASESGVEPGDFDILIAAQIAEALAVTTYFTLLETAPFVGGLPPDDQNYLAAALQEEMPHFLLEKSVTQTHTPFTSFFYPKGMFEHAQTSLNTLVTLEDAFIAAYLVGVRNFSTTRVRSGHNAGARSARH